MLFVYIQFLSTARGVCAAICPALSAGLSFFLTKEGAVI